MDVFSGKISSEIWADEKIISALPLMYNVLQLSQSRILAFHFYDPVRNEVRAKHLTKLNQNTICECFQQ